MHWAMFYCTVLISSLVSTASPHVISQDEVMLEVRRGEQAPFVVIWNAPTKGCEKCGVDVDVKRYGMKENTDDKWMGAEIALFYAGNLGLYPFYDTDGNAVNGGLPQVRIHSIQYSYCFQWRITDVYEAMVHLLLLPV